jgi:hypothetical protein
MRPGCAAGSAAGTGSGSAAGAGGGVASTFAPVHSRKLPHDPQKLSDGSFWKPHFVQTITGPLLVGRWRRRRPGRRVRAW